MRTSRHEVKIGTRVPVESKQGEFTYLDVGTGIWCGLEERANGLAISVRAEISNLPYPTSKASRRDQCCVNYQSKPARWHK